MQESESANDLDRYDTLAESSDSEGESKRSSSLKPKSF